MYLAVAVAAVLALTIAPSARAGITFTLGNHPQPGEENVLFKTTQTGSLVTGFTNHTATEVDFSSTQTLFASAKGQAKIEAVDSKTGGQVPVTDLTIALAKGTYGDLIMNPEITGGIGKKGDATVTVVANDGTFHFTYGLGNGNNFLTIVATGGETILSTNISAPKGFTDLKQPRISGLGSVPEPSTLGLAGTGLLSLLAAYGWRRRHSRPA
jgi:hypothetical protein